MTEERQIRDGCNQRLKNIEEKVDKLEETTKDMPTINYLTQQMVETNKQQSKAIEDINHTLLKVNDNMDRMSEKYDDLKLGQDKMNDKVDGLEKEIQTDRNKNMIDMRDWFKKNWGKIMLVVVLGYEIIVKLIVPGAGKLIG